MEDLVEATSVPKPDLCRACFDGVYPIELPETDRLGKHLLEAPAGATALPVFNTPEPHAEPHRLHQLRMEK
jgi:amidophosphoribosyltransferase